MGDHNPTMRQRAMLDFMVVKPKSTPSRESTTTSVAKVSTPPPQEDAATVPRGKKADAEQMWGEEVDRVLKNKFKFDSFRPMQRDIVLSVLSGKDTFVLMPTGGDKSLC